MKDDRSLRSHESTENQRRKTVATLSRRDLLKQTAITGSLGVSGVVSSGRAVASASIDESGTIEDTPKDDGPESSLGKILFVEGTGTGRNSYRFSMGDIVTSEVIVKAQVVGADEPLITGEVRKGCTDVYCFAGEVIGVSARGKITYHVDNQ